MSVPFIKIDSNPRFDFMLIFPNKCAPYIPP